MRDTIYRDEAVEICERWRQRAKEHHDRNGWYMADILLRFMKEMPSADRPQGEAPLEHGYMWTCPKCELEVHSDFDTCPRCGYEREDRPQGEWIIEKDINGNTYGRCSICGMKQYAGQLNFCPDCGAQMKGAVNESID